MNEAKIKACVESYERHLDGAVKMGELPTSTDQKYLTDLLAEILKAQAGGRQPEPIKTMTTLENPKPKDEAKGIATLRTSDLLACAEIGARWKANSSLEEWFPFSAQKLKSLEAEVGNSAGILVMQNRVIRRLAGELVAAIERCNQLTPDDQIQILVPSVEDAIGAAEMAEHEHAKQANAPHEPPAH